MVRILLCVMGVLGSPLSTYAQWEAVNEKLRDSVVEVNGTCTGFVINNDLVLTAAHCEEKEMFADTLRAVVVMKDPKKDLMVLRVKGLERPALQLAAKDPVVGQQVASLGFGYGSEEPMFRLTYIASVGATVNGRSPLLVTDAAFVPGQSGGPVVNAAGEVVMMVQLASDRVGAGDGVEVLRKKVSRFLP